MSIGDNGGMASGRRQLIDPKAVAPLLHRARIEAGLSVEGIARAIGTTTRSVNRWEAAVVPPTLAFHEPLVTALAQASHASWVALVQGLGLSLKGMLARVPVQAAHANPPPPPPEPESPKPPPLDPRVVLDHAVRGTAEDLDVSPRKVRAAFAQLVVDLERLGLSYAAARDVLLGRTSD